MAFNLPFSVRISNDQPADGDRALIADDTVRDQLIIDGRAYEGLIIYHQTDKLHYKLKTLGATPALSVWEALIGQEIIILVSKTFSDWSIASTSKNVSIFSLLPKFKIISIIAEVKTAFVGVTNVNLDLGIVGDLTKYTPIGGKSVMTSTFYDIAPNTIESLTASTDIRATLTGDSNLNGLTAGAIDFHITVKKRLK